MQLIGSRGQQTRDHYFSADGSIVAGNTSQLLLPERKSTSFLFIENLSNEALYLEFAGPEWHPSIAKVCVGKVNAISGGMFSESISGHNQDYILIPQQRWLDGINAGDGVVRQFVAMPLGTGYSVEAQVTDEETSGGFQFFVMQPKEGRFPRRNPVMNEIFEKVRQTRKAANFQIDSSVAAAIILNHEEKRLYFSLLNIEEPRILFQPAAGYEDAFPSSDENISMAIAAGGSIKQEVFADTYGPETWDVNNSRLVTIHMVNSIAYESITGEPPPPSPISKEDYEYHGIPWYSNYSESSPKLKAASAFRRILGVSAIDKKRGLIGGSSDRPINISPEEIKRIRTPDVTEAIETYRKRAYASAGKSEWKRSLSEISNAIDLNVNVKSSDYALRCCCNYNLGQYIDGEIDGSLGLEIEPSSKDARSWRACCRLASGDHEGLKEDADILIGKAETAIFGFEMRAEAAMLSGRYHDAIRDALSIRELDATHARAELILTKARSMESQNG